MDNLLPPFLNREVTVESGGLKIRGQLVGISESQGRPDHKPFTLILQSPEGQRFLIRGWSMIALDWRL